MISARAETLASALAAAERRADRMEEEAKAARTAAAEQSADKKSANEPAEKKHKGGGEEERREGEREEERREATSPGGGELAAQVAALRAENVRLAAERDANLLSYRTITEVRGLRDMVARKRTDGCFFCRRPSRPVLSTSRCRLLSRGTSRNRRVLFLALFANHSRKESNLFVQAGHAAALREAHEALAAAQDGVRHEREVSRAVASVFPPTIRRNKHLGGASRSVRLPRRWPDCGANWRPREESAMSCAPSSRPRRWRQTRYFLLTLLRVV